MSSTFSRWILPVILVLVAIVGWGAYFLSSESPGTGQIESAGLDQELQTLQENFAELQLDQESLLQENIALRALNDSLRSEDASGTGQASYQRLPGGRENYLAKRLQFASEQLQRHRRGMYQQSTVSANVSNEMVDSDQQTQTDTDQQTRTETAATQPFEAQSQQLREQLADQAESFEKERMNYTQTIELLSDKLEEALVSRIIQSSKTGDESVVSKTDGSSSVTGDGLVAQVNQPDAMGDSSMTSESDESSDVSSQPASETKQLAETSGTEATVESGQAGNLTVAAVQPSTQTESSNDAVPAQDSDASDSTERLEEQINGILEKLTTAELNQAAMVKAQEEMDQLNQQLQSERSENQQLHQALQTLNERVVLLNTELNSANERTHNMEMMTETITEENRRFGELIDDLQETLGMTIAERDSQISSIESEFTMIEYSTDILFESGSTVLSEKGKQILKEFFVNLEVDEFSDRVINIEGHTDNVPIAGNLLTLYPSNWELSLARAASATRFLIEQGVGAERLRPVGRGSSQPRASNDTEAGRAANRRIEIHLAPELQRIQN